MKTLVSLKGITLSIGIVLGCFGVGLQFRSDGSATASASYSIGSVKQSQVTCFNWKEITNPSKLFGCGPGRNDRGKTQSVNLADKPLIWTVTRDPHGHLTSSVGIGTTISEPSGNVGLSIALTKQIYSDHPDPTPQMPKDFFPKTSFSSLVAANRKQDKELLALLMRMEQERTPLYAKSLSLKGRLNAELVR